jgi:hypothetical protein
MVKVVRLRWSIMAAAAVEYSTGWPLRVIAQKDRTQLKEASTSKNRNAVTPVVTHSENNVEDRLVPGSKISWFCFYLGRNKTICCERTNSVHW